MEAEEHAGALEAAEEVRAIQKDPALVGIACAGEALTRNVAEIERLCGAEIAQQWRDCALLPRGATAQRGGGAPAPEHCSPSSAPRGTRGSAPARGGRSAPALAATPGRRRRFDGHQGRVLGESRGGLGPDERAFADAATNVYPRLTRALRASCVGEASNGIRLRGVAGDAMRLWRTPPKTSPRRRGERRAPRSSPRAPYGETRFRRAKKKKTFRRRSALCRRPCWRARWRRWRRRRTSTPCARRCARRRGARSASRLLPTPELAPGSSSSARDSSVSATSASSAASEGTNADAGEAGEAGDAGEAGFDTLETAFGFETFDAGKISAESDDERASGARAAAVSVACAASEAASSAPPRRRAAIASAASDAARRVADAAQRSFADLLAGFGVGADRTTERRERGSRPSTTTIFFQTRDHLSSVEVCESFARAAETLGRRRCLALRSAVTRRSARWLARLARRRRGKMRDALEVGNLDRPGGQRNNKKSRRLGFFSVAAAEAYLRRAARAGARAGGRAAPERARARLQRARSCRLVLGAGGDARRRAPEERHRRAPRRDARRAAPAAGGGARLRDARRELAPLLRSPAPRRDVWEKEAAKTARDLDAHCAEIRAKLVGIMRERCEARCAEIRACAAIGRAGPESARGRRGGRVRGWRRSARGDGNTNGARICGDGGGGGARARDYRARGRRAHRRRGRGRRAFGDCGGVRRGSRSRARVGPMRRTDRRTDRRRTPRSCRSRRLREARRRLWRG